MARTSTFRAGARLDSAAIRAAAEAHPRLRRFVRLVGEHAEGGDARAMALLEHLVRRVADDVGDVHLTHVLARLERIEALRDTIAAILDHVLDGGELPPGVKASDLGRHFDDLSAQMHDLRKTQRALLGSEKSFLLGDDSASYAADVLADFEGRPAGQGVHPGGDARVKAAVDLLPPPQQAALRKAAALEPAAVAKAVMADTEGLQARALAQLEQALAGRLTPTELADLRAATTAAGKAHFKASLVDDVRLAQALERIGDRDLRAVVVAGDPWIVQQLAIHNPTMLAVLWKRFRDNGGRPDDVGGFRAYVRHEMVTYGRAVPGEFTAAFSLGSVLTLLKGPDVDVKVRGTDLVGVTSDGWVWLIDDKSHRAASVSSVTALTDNLATNLRRDVADFEAAIAELKARDPAFRPDPAILDAIDRMKAAAKEVDRIESTGKPANRPARLHQALVDLKIKLKVTSAMGEVTEVSQALADLGITVQPTRPADKPPIVFPPRGGSQ